MRGSEPDRAAPAPVARYDAPAPDLRGTVPPRDRAPAQRPDAPERNSLPVRADAARYAAPEYRRRQPPQEAYRAPPPQVEPEPYDPEPRLAPDYDQDWETPAGRDRRRAASAARPPRTHGRVPPCRRRSAAAATKSRSATTRRPSEAAASRLPASSSPSSSSPWSAVSARSRWSQRAMISDLIAGFESGSSGGTAEQPVLPPTAGRAGRDRRRRCPRKNTDRLLAGRRRRRRRRPMSASSATARPPMAGARHWRPPSRSHGCPADPTRRARCAGGAQKAILYEEPLERRRRPMRRHRDRCRGHLELRRRRAQRPGGRGEPRRAGART